MAQTGSPRDEVYRALPDADSARQIEFIEADGEYLHLNESEAADGGEGGDDGDENWEPSSIRQLLALYVAHVDKFRNPKVRKKNVWTEIATLVGKSADGCDKKFRNLKQTYVRLLKKRKRTGGAPVKWPYFETFEEIYVSGGRYHPEIELKVLRGAGEAAGAAEAADAAEESEGAWGRAERGEAGEGRRRLVRRRRSELRRVADEMRGRQRAVEEKLDRLIGVVEESNAIQRERNQLFERFLDNIHSNS